MVSLVNITLCYRQEPWQNWRMYKTVPPDSAGLWCSHRPSGESVVWQT